MDDFFCVHSFPSSFLEDEGRREEDERCLRNMMIKKRVGEGRETPPLHAPKTTMRQ